MEQEGSQQIIFVKTVIIAAHITIKVHSLDMLKINQRRDQHMEEASPTRITTTKA